MYLLSLLPAILSAAVLALTFVPSIHKRFRKWQLPAVILAYIATRLGIYLLVYVVLGHSQGDIVWFQWEGLGALEHKLPYRDFQCLHSPLFPYLMAIPYGIYNQVSSCVVLFIAFDLMSMILLCKIAGMMLGSDKVLDTAWLYTMNPFIWSVTARYGQDESVILFFICLAIYAHMRNHRWIEPAILCLGIMCTKITTAFPMFAVYTYSKTKMRDAAIVMAGVIAIAIPFYAAGANLAMPFANQSSDVVGLSATHVLKVLFLQHTPSKLISQTATVVTVLASCGVLFLAHKRRLHILSALIAAQMTFLLFAPVSYRMYDLWYMGPLTVYALWKNQLPRFISFSTLLVLCDDYALRLPESRPIHHIMLIVSTVTVVFVAKYIADILRGSPAEECTPKVRREQPI